MTIMRSVSGLVLSVVLLVLLPSAASALRFDMDSGSVVVYLRESGVDLATIGPFAMNGPGDFADFSPSPVAMTDFQFSALGIQDELISQLAGGGSLPGLWGWRWLDIDVIATPGQSYTAWGTDLGGGDFLLEGTDVDLTGIVTVKHWDGFTKSVSLTFPQYTADANLTNSMLILDKVTLGGVTLSDEFGSDHDFEVVADIVFVGTLVPEPGSGVLVGLGLGLLARRRRSTRIA